MAQSARERMVASAVVLLAKRGFQGASFAEVLADSGAPRGSIYHHFPDGKEQLIAAAVDHAGAQAVQILDALDGHSAVEVVDGFMAVWRSILERSGFTAGCSVLAVTVSADSRELLNRAGEAFRSWQARLAELFARPAWRTMMRTLLPPCSSPRAKARSCLPAHNRLSRRSKPSTGSCATWPCLMAPTPERCARRTSCSLARYR